MVGQGPAVPALSCSFLRPCAHPAQALGDGGQDQTPFPSPLSPLSQPAHPGHVLSPAVHVVFDPAEHSPVHLLLRGHVEAVAGNEVQHLQGRVGVGGQRWLVWTGRKGDVPSCQPGGTAVPEAERCLLDVLGVPNSNGVPQSSFVGTSLTILPASPPLLWLRLLQCLTIPVTVSGIRGVTPLACVPPMFPGTGPGALAAPRTLPSPAKGCRAGAGGDVSPPLTVTLPLPREWVKGGV